ncbi:hypothetical protein J8273_1954 [Carpediemonas membranifera]|uniref:Uncharacterized protein n=1 Tax=Carpediemonas membranifera TaxID=201153 RepID=A0A8J6E6B6_9EUKA|nr:hypothetical protein J8273_1954 [Carpediemonas membranifera]|eukprot:KAG9396907.1 hypothetical protein J8273_1954 [Carpediemonas membranifera]
MNSRGLNRFSLTAHLSYTRRVADMRASSMVRATVLGGILVLAPAEEVPFRPCLGGRTLLPSFASVLVCYALICRPLPASEAHVVVGSAGTPSCAPYRHFARALPGIMFRHNVVVSVTMVSEFRTSIVCPYCKAHFRRVVHTHRTMLCQNPACEGAPWRVERLRRHPEQRDILLNLSRRDKSASENILWCTFDATSDQIEQSPFHYDYDEVLFLAIINLLS